ncbi:hypothetical protein FHX08_003421 [Rhizobium sp. BK529]|uniref:PPC domain-containing DNA-binding protein n=1 Tax=unclassified Rhizobium TaxID=2613769 RepID=UPI001045FC4F|nr:MULTISPECIES: PPC domain-containing DNA-binding protein [unclassified Rhizobium]MBB3593077.1 hypothetical protein [Rhizobium sp. BK529]TCS07458.1 hypothetical protein EV281_1021077 [Rhizobium sp. BK418]
MQSKLLSDEADERTFILILDDGEEAFAAISRFAELQSIDGASISAIGAFSSAVVGFFDFKTKTYRKIPIEEQCEVLSTLGDLARGDDGKPSLHLHVVLGLSDGNTRGGHFIEGFVHPTLEIIIRENPVGLRRKRRPDLGIALIDLDLEADPPPPIVPFSR